MRKQDETTNKLQGEASTEEDATLGSDNEPLEPELEKLLGALLEGEFERQARQRARPARRSSRVGDRDRDL